MEPNYELEEDRRQEDREIVFEETVNLPFGCRLEFWGTLSNEMTGPGMALGYQARIRYAIIIATGYGSGGYLGNKYDKERSNLKDWMYDQWRRWKESL